jgi:hypothetical protein
MSEQQLQLRVALELDPGADAAEVEERTLQLREELLELDVDDVQQPSVGPPPEGAKGVEGALLGTLVLTAGREAVSAVVHLIAGWLSRGGARSIKLRIGDDLLELSDASKEQQQQAMEAFLARHPPSSGS